MLWNENASRRPFVPVLDSCFLAKVSSRVPSLRHPIKRLGGHQLPLLLRWYLLLEEAQVQALRPPHDPGYHEEDDTDDEARDDALYQHEGEGGGKDGCYHRVHDDDRGDECEQTEDRDQRHPSDPAARDLVGVVEYVLPPVRIDYRCDRDYPRGQECPGDR